MRELTGSAAGGNTRKQRSAFGAIAKAVRGIFDIAAAKYPTIFHQRGRTHLEA
jgi:hypothetical protein